MKILPSLAPFKQSLSLPGGNLFYYDSERSADSENNASDKPAILLIHGLGDEADTWRHIFPTLANAGYRIIAPDLPGFGRSLWKERITIRRHSQAIARLMATTARASAEHPIVLIGSSLGAGIAEIAAISHPELVKGVIMIGGCFPFDYKIDKSLILLMLPFFGKNWYHSFRSNHEAAWKSLYPYYHDLDSMSSDDKDFLRERVIARVESSNQEHGYFSTMRSMYPFLLFGKRSMARKIRAFPGKINLIWGKNDRVFPPEKAGLFRSLRPDVDIIFIDGAGHLPQQEKPDECATEIVRILESHRP